MLKVIIKDKMTILGVNGIESPIKIPILWKKTSCKGMYFSSFT
jgi:hypothetical protein